MYRGIVARCSVENDMWTTASGDSVATTLPRSPFASEAIATVSVAKNVYMPAACQEMSYPAEVFRQLQSLGPKPPDLPCEADEGL